MYFPQSSGWVQLDEIPVRALTTSLSMDISTPKFLPVYGTKARRTVIIYWALNSIHLYTPTHTQIEHIFAFLCLDACYDLNWNVLLIAFLYLFWKLFSKNEIKLNKTICAPPVQFSNLYIQSVKESHTISLYTFHGAKWCFHGLFSPHLLHRYILGRKTFMWASNFCTNETGTCITAKSRAYTATFC